MSSSLELGKIFVLNSTDERSKSNTKLPTASIFTTLNPMEALLFIGIPGAGKSTFFRQRFFDTHQRINRDTLRTKPRENAIIEVCLKYKLRFVLDNTSPTRATRAPFIARAQSSGFRVHAFYFEPDYAASRERNARRTGRARVPTVAIGSILNALQPPSFDEGFSAIFSVWNRGADGFEVKEWPREI